jgi:hypothetical protein
MKTMTALYMVRKMPCTQEYLRAVIIRTSEWRRHPCKMLGTKMPGQAVQAPYFVFLALSNRMVRPPTEGTEERHLRIRWRKIPFAFHKVCIWNLPWMGRTTARNRNRRHLGRVNIVTPHLAAARAFSALAELRKGLYEIEP